MKNQAVIEEEANNLKEDIVSLKEDINITGIENNILLYDELTTAVIKLDILEWVLADQLKGRD